MNRISRLVLVLSVIVSATSCIKEKLEETYNKQEEQIDKYVSGALEKDENYTVAYNDGSTRLTKVAGEGPELSSSGFVSFYYAGYTFNGGINASALFGTNHQATAEQAGWTLTDPEYELMEIDMKDSRLLEGVRKGLEGVKAGEECEILFCGKYGFGKKPFGIIPANSALLYKIWVISISND